MQCDVNEWEDQQRAVAAAHDSFGRLDAAFANAGFGAKRGFLEETPEFWRDMVLTNVYGAALTVRASIPSLRESRGHLLLTGSVAGRVAHARLSLLMHQVGGDGDGGGRPPGAARAAASESPCVEPGMVDTPFFDNSPQGALQADDIARWVLYALSEPPHVNVNELADPPARLENSGFRLGAKTREPPQGAVRYLCSSQTPAAAKRPRWRSPARPRRAAACRGRRRARRRRRRRRRRRHPAVSQASLFLRGLRRAPAPSATSRAPNSRPT